MPVQKSANVSIVSAESLSASCHALETDAAVWWQFFSLHISKNSVSSSRLLYKILRTERECVLYRSINL